MRQGAQAPSILVINKVDRATAASVALPDEVRQVFLKRVAACATQGVGLQELDVAILDLVGLGHVSSGGQQWAVNQVCTICCPGRFLLPESLSPY